MDQNLGIRRYGLGTTAISIKDMIIFPHQVEEEMKLIKLMQIETHRSKNRLIKDRFLNLFPYSVQ